MKTGKFIDKSKLLNKISEYKDLNCWNTKELDSDTILRVLSVVENIIRSQEPVKKSVLRAYEIERIKLEKEQFEYMVVASEKNAKNCNTLSKHEMLTGFYRGMSKAYQDVISWLDNIVWEE